MLNYGAEKEKERTSTEDEEMSKRVGLNERAPGPKQRMKYV